MAVENRLLIVLYLYRGKWSAINIHQQLSSNMKIIGKPLLLGWMPLLGG